MWCSFPRMGIIRFLCGSEGCLEKALSAYRVLRMRFAHDIPDGRCRGGRMEKDMGAKKEFIPRGLAMVNMLIFVIMFTILSGIMMTVVSSSGRLLEQHVRRTKAYYLTEGAVVYAMDFARRSGGAGNWVIRPIMSPGNMPWSFDSSGNVLAVKPAPIQSTAAATGPGSTYQLNGSVIYTLNW